MHLRILTYNIHKGIGGIDRRYDLGRVAEVIAHYDPHIALLQEVDDGVGRSRNDRQISELACQLGFSHALFQPNVAVRQGAYGNAILSRFPIREPRDVDLTVSPKKRRRAQVGRLELQEEGRQRTLVVVNLHLGLSGFERRIQLRRLLREPSIHRMHAATPCIVGGDFNDFWGSIPDRIMKPIGFVAASGSIRTFPAVAPMRRLDAIYYRGNCSVHHGFAGTIQRAREASDHLPLIADLEVRFPHEEGGEE